MRVRLASSVALILALSAEATVVAQGTAGATPWSAAAPASHPTPASSPRPAAQAVDLGPANGWRAGAEDAATLGPPPAVPGWLVGQGPASVDADTARALIGPPGGEDGPGCVTCVCGEAQEGEPICANGYVDNFNGGCNSTPNVFGRIACGQTICGTYGTYLSPTGASFRDTDWYEFTLAVASDVTWTVIGEARTRVFLMSGSCPASSLGSAVADPCLPASVTVANLAAGTYRAFVGTDAFSGVPCGRRYRGTLTAVNCCVPRCLPGDQIEGEPICSNGYVDNWNGGCNSNPNVFGRIECGQSVCGTYGTFLSATGANFRDTDWYTFTLPVASDVTWTATGGARTRVFLMSGSCPASSLGSAAADPCLPASVTVANLAAGTYRAFVGTDAFSGVPCGTPYRATLTVTNCCVGPCRPGDLVEGEPICSNGYVDSFNGGCNSNPNVFGRIDCGQSVCGTYGTFLSATGANFRDTDWYTFTLHQASNVTWTATGEARTRVFLMSGSCPASSLGSGVADPCLPATVTVTGLAAGTYHAFVGTDAFSGVPCGARYRATLTVAECCVGPCRPGDQIEGEPVCSNGYVDSFNGGCNSTPNAFGAITCGETVCGTYGTFLSATGANFRDTDWYRFTLPAPATVTWTAIGEARTRVFIMSGSCPASSLGSAVAIPCQPASVTVNLAAGTYAALVATDVFAGVPCGARYRATLITTPCVNDNPITSLDSPCGNGGNQTTAGSFAIGSGDFEFILTGAEPNAFLLSTLGFPGTTLPCGACTLTDPASILFRVNNGGTASRPLAIPCDPGLAGLTLDAQWVSFFTSTNPCPAAPGLSASNRLRCVLRN